MKPLSKISVLLISCLLLGLIYYHQTVTSTLVTFLSQEKTTKDSHYLDNETTFNLTLQHIVEASKGLIVSILYDQSSQTLNVTISDEVVFLSDDRKNKLITWLQPKLKEAFANSSFATNKLNHSVIAKLSLIYEDSSLFCNKTNLDNKLILSKN